MPYGFFNWKDKIRRYAVPSAREWRDMFISVLVLGLIIGFDDGRDSFNLALWFGNYIVSVGVAAIAFFSAEMTKRILVVKAGFRPEYKMWPNGLALGMILVFMSGGKFWYFLAPGGMVVHHLVGHRLGYFRYGLNTKARAVTNLGGPLMAIIIAAIFKNINLYFAASPIPVLDKIFFVCLWFGVINMLPFPTLAGGEVFYFSKPFYSFAMGTILSYAIMVTAFDMYSWILALFIGGIIWLVYMMTIEQKLMWG